MSVAVVAIAWSEQFGGGWEAWCDDCGSVWSETTSDEFDLDAMLARAESAALLHEDNDHASIVYRDGDPWVTPRVKSRGEAMSANHAPPTVVTATVRMEEHHG